MGLHCPGQRLGLAASTETFFQWHDYYTTIHMKIQMDILSSVGRLTQMQQAVVV